MDRRSVRLNGAGSRKSQEADAAEETVASKGGGTTRTVTVTSSQRVVTRRSAAGANSLNYEVDPWEISPKTDYTYSRTRSYLKQPVNDNYISPNMSRLGLRGSATHVVHEYASTATKKNTDVVRNLALERSYEDEASGGVGDGRGVAMATPTQVSHHSGSGDTYMTLRTRKLTTQQESGNWRTYNTYTMRNMHGTDLEEELSDTESMRDQRPIMIRRRSLVDRFTSFIVMVVQTCWTVVTYLPRTAASKMSTLVTGISKSSDNHVHHTTKRTRTTTSMTTTSTTTTVLASESRWKSFRNAVMWVVSFLLVTLPVGLVSWAMFGIISSGKFIGRTTMNIWQWVEKILQSTVTNTTRVADAAVLSRTSLPRRRCGCLCLVPLLFLVPLLVFGLLYAASCQRDDVAVVGSAVYDRFSTFFFPLFATREQDEKEASDVTEATVAVNAGGASKADTDKGSIGKNDVSLMAIAEMEKRINELFLVFAADHKVTAQAEQDRELSAFRSQLVHLVKMIVQRELQVQRIALKTSEKDGRAILVAEQQKQMAALQNSLDVLAAKTNTMSAELSGLKASLSVGRSEPQPANEAELLELEKHIKKLDAELIRLKEKYDELTTTLIRTRIHEYFVQVMGGGSFGAGSTQVRDDGAATEAGDSGSMLPFGVWLNQQFANREDMNKVLELLAANITKEINEKAAANEGLMAKIAEAAIVAKWASEKEKSQQDASAAGGIIGGTRGGATEGSAPCTLCDGQLTVGDVLKLIHTELGIYDADKTGKVDYALESAGGSIISVRCSQTYQLQTAQTSVFGIPLWYTYNSPRVIIQPGVHPGDCWAFTGSQGYVVIQLSRQIFITEVSIEHIPKTLSPSGKIDSAPKDFEIWGLESEADLAGAPLGNFTYDDSGTPIQTFSLESANGASFRFVELKINSNYGQESYTCLYRFRVHGILDLSLA